MAHLVRMTQEQFDRYLDAAIAGYAEEKVQAGNWSAEDALARSRQEFLKLLPQGLATPNQHLFAIVDDTGEQVGFLWFAVMQEATGPVAFVYDFGVDESQRRKGYGEQAFSAMEDEVRALGLHTIQLHVFGHNRPAIALYEKLGYAATNIMMSKTLEPAA
ncbi:MAG: GNAT family N-acetyltransferase [Anaerolineae bacterium]